MSIASIGAGSPALANLPLSGITSANSARQDGDSNEGGQRITPNQGGKLHDAIAQGLSQLGTSGQTVNSTSGSSDAAAAKDQQQVLAVFIQNLFAALHAQTQTGQSAPDVTVAAGISSLAAAGTVSGSATHGHRHGDGVGKLEGDLKSLIQKISAPTSNDTSSTSNSSAGTTADSSSSSTLSNLQQSFSALLSADGVAGDAATLNSFLQSLSQNLQGVPATGNIVSTKV